MKTQIDDGQPPYVDGTLISAVIVATCLGLAIIAMLIVMICK